MPTRKTLDLKVTVTCSDLDPDAVLARMDKDQIRLSATGTAYTLKVTSVERADGQEFGLEAEFESWWQDNQDPDDSTVYDASYKDWARDAFLYGVKYAKGKQ